MNKQAIITAISEEYDITKIQAKAIFEKIFEEIIVAVSSKDQPDNKIQIPGFGSFRMETRPAREGRNPRTGETMQIEEKQVIKFKASKTLLDRIN